MTSGDILFRGGLGAFLRHVIAQPFRHGQCAGSRPGHPLLPDGSTQPTATLQDGRGLDAAQLGMFDDFSDQVLHDAR